MNCPDQLVSSAGRSEHISPVLKGWHWLPVEQHLKFKVLCLTYKALHGLTPSYLHESLIPYKPARSLCSTNQDLLGIPKMRLKRIAARAFSSLAPSLYNAIPLDILQAPSFDSFKANLNTHPSTPLKLISILICSVLRITSPETPPINYSACDVLLSIIFLIIANMYKHIPVPRLYIM